MSFYGIVVYIFHEIFNDAFWNEEYVEFFDGMFMYGTFDSGHDGDDQVHFLAIILEYGYERIIFDVFVFKGLLMESIMALCKFYELECDRWGGGDGEGALVGAFYYAWDVYT